MLDMKFITVLVAISAMPSVSLADTWINDLIESAKNGNGTVVETHSSASSGGQRVSGGESVSTGDVSASSHVETYINADGSDGEVKVKVETSHNGETKTEEYVAPIQKGTVKVETHSESNREYTSEVKVDGEVVATESGEPHVAAASESKISVLFSEKIPEFFKDVLAFLWIF
jgi:hypothetical protein